MGMLKKALAGLGKGAVQMAPIMIENLYRQRMLESQNRYRDKELALRRDQLKEQQQHHSKVLNLQREQLESIDTYRRGLITNQQDQIAAQKEYWNKKLAADMARARAAMAAATNDKEYKAAKLELERLKAMKDMLGSATTVKVPVVLGNKVAQQEVPAFRLPDGRTVVEPRYSEAYFTGLVLAEAKQRGLSYDDPQVTKRIAKLKAANDVAWSKVTQSRMEVLQKFGSTLPGRSGITVGDYINSLGQQPQQPVDQPQQPVDQQSVEQQPAAIDNKGAGLINNMLQGKPEKQPTRDKQRKLGAARTSTGIL